MHNFYKLIHSSILKSVISFVSSLSSHNPHHSTCCKVESQASAIVEVKILKSGNETKLMTS